MAKQREHDKILQAAARNILRPQGLVQKGRSRTWLDDRGWWLVVVEFQPSSWSRGAYLNVGAMWLFHPQEHLSFHQGYRQHGHVEYRNDEQFAEAAKSLCEQACAKVFEYRTKYESLLGVKASLEASLAEDLARHRFHADIWHLYFAGVVAGLLGQRDHSEGLLAETLHEAFIIPWQLALKEESRALLAASSQQDFRTLVQANVVKCREMLKLSPWAAVLGA